jgi:broad specificity phosphatase PhoE
MSFVHLLRHAQSTFNTIYDRTEVDPLDFDAPLSDNGRRQAAETRRRIRGMDEIDLVVTSPLTRAIETALLVFRDSVPIVVESLHREWQYNSCDVGRPASVLAAEFPELRFDHLPDTWWYQGKEDQRGVAVEPKSRFLDRVASFSGWLEARPECRIVVVGHSTFFAYLAGVQLDNCETYQWRPAPLADIAAMSLPGRSLRASPHTEEGT